tara:strand:- start:245 stop:967 length:723 start_codon:yes stop_codon:yes gene_type:complete
MPKIRFYPFNEQTAEFAPAPKPGLRFVPDWYKAQAGSKDDEWGIPQGFATSTVKRCMPVFDAMTAGYMLVAPCDIHLDSTDPEKLSWSLPIDMRKWEKDLFSFHGFDQYDSYPIDPEDYHKQLLRIMPFWAVGTDDGYSTFFMNPHHTDNSPLWAFSALVDTDQFVSDGHLSFLVKKDFKGTIKQGTPLVQIFPVRREEWESELADPAETKIIFRKQRAMLRSVFTGGYKAKFRSKKDYR